MWMLPGLRAGYEATLDEDFLDLAISHFDTVYTTDRMIPRRGAIWRLTASNTNESKNDLGGSTNGPAILTAYLIYKYGGGSGYLAKAEASTAGIGRICTTPARERCTTASIIRA
jgi:hypothetical protein